jgi:hypothetical protein
MVRENESYFVLFVLGGSILELGSLVWLSVTIKCRTCNAHLGWRAIRGQNSDNWFSSLFTNEICPVCRHGSEN